MSKDRIKYFMAKVFQGYKEFLHSGQKEFWDLIVLTTYDEVQKQSFLAQLEELYGNNPFLKGKFYVIADPPNLKLGCGGSTLHVLQTLIKERGPELYRRKILVIHSGGSSQRLPSYSMQGKIFSAVPVEELQSNRRECYMIDLKLAMYLPFCELLQPGVFVTCSDDIETYFLDDAKLDKQQLLKADVVALAHPCDLSTATCHGVYLLPDISSNPESVVICECLEVLQKPSKTLLKEKKAILKNSAGKEIVYSDSVFWMSDKVYRPLVAWFIKNSPLQTELDAYGHFLPCLGKHMMDCFSELFTNYKSKLFPILKNFNLKVLVLKESKFYHIGTMKEYLENFTMNKSFCKELGLVDITNYNNVFSCISDNETQKKNGMIMSSHFPSSTNKIFLEGKSKFIVEWCIIDIPILIAESTILSNCVLKKCSPFKNLSEPIAFYGNFLYHTAPITCNGNVFYVTVAFDINSDMKQIYYHLNEMNIASVPLDRILQLANLKEKDVLAEGKPFSLWTLKLFQPGKTPEESFWITHQFLQTIFHWKDEAMLQTEPVSPTNCVYFSMKEIVQFKDLDTFLADKKILLHLIASE